MLYSREEYETYYEAELRKRLKEAPKQGAGGGDSLALEGKEFIDFGILEILFQES